MSQSQTLKLNPHLFKLKDGAPTLFHLPPGRTKMKLTLVITECGGQVTSKRQTDNICLVDERLWSRGSNLLSTSSNVWPTFVVDCILQDTLLDVEKYRCHRGPALMRTLPSIVVKKSSGLIVFQDVMVLDDGMAPATAVISLPSESHAKGRQKYTKAEDMNIIKYLILNNEYQRSRGIAVWNLMRLVEVTSHSAQSMMTRYRDIIVKQLDTYNIPHFWKTRLTGDPCLPDNTEKGDEGQATLDDFLSTATTSTSRPRATEAGSAPGSRRKVAAPGPPDPQPFQVALGDSTDEDADDFDQHLIQLVSTPPDGDAENHAAVDRDAGLDKAAGTSGADASKSTDRDARNNTSTKTAQLSGVHASKSRAAKRHPHGDGGSQVRVSVVDKSAGDRTEDLFESSAGWKTMTRSTGCNAGGNSSNSSNSSNSAGKDSPGRKNITNFAGRNTNYLTSAGKDETERGKRRKSAGRNTDGNSSSSSSSGRSPSKPSNTRPAPSKPGNTRPSTSSSKPGSTRPSTSKPGNTRLSTSKPGNTRLSPSKPGNTRQSPSKPGNTRQSPSEPGSSRQSPAKPRSSKPSPSKPGSIRPSSSRVDRQNCQGTDKDLDWLNVEGSERPRKDPLLADETRACSSEIGGDRTASHVQPSSRGRGRPRKNPLWADGMHGVSGDTGGDTTKKSPLQLLPGSRRSPIPSGGIPAAGSDTGGKRGRGRPRKTPLPEHGRLVSPGVAENLPQSSPRGSPVRKSSRMEAPEQVGRSRVEESLSESPPRASSPRKSSSSRVGESLSESPPRASSPRKSSSSRVGESLSESPPRKSARIGHRDDASAGLGGTSPTDSSGVSPGTAHAGGTERAGSGQTESLSSSHAGDTERAGSGRTESNPSRPAAGASPKTTLSSPREDRDGTRRRVRETSPFKSPRGSPRKLARVADSQRASPLVREACLTKSPLNNSLGTSSRTADKEPTDPSGREKSQSLSPAKGTQRQQKSSHTTGHGSESHVSESHVSESHVSESHVSESQGSECRVSESQSSESHGRESRDSQATVRMSPRRGMGVPAVSSHHAMQAFVCDTDDEEENEQNSKRRRHPKKLTALGVMRAMSFEFGLTVSECRMLLRGNSGHVDSTRHWILTGRPLPGHLYWTPEEDRVLQERSPDHPRWLTIEGRCGTAAVLRRIHWLRVSSKE